jgi:hypothetical protein
MLQRLVHEHPQQFLVCFSVAIRVPRWFVKLERRCTFGKGCALNDINVVTIMYTPFFLPYVVGDEK